jgi:hypothetical protein
VGVHEHKSLNIAALYNRLTDGVRLSALSTGQERSSGTHFFKKLSKPQDLARPEGLGKLKKVIHLIGSRTRDLPACSIVSQLPRYTC